MTAPNSANGLAHVRTLRGVAREAGPLDGAQPPGRVLTRDGRGLIRPLLPHAAIPMTAPVCGPAAYTLALMAIVLQMTVSGNLLFLAGIPYDVPGGFPGFKLHPATYLAVAAMLLVLLSNAQPLRQLLQMDDTNRGLAVSISALVFCVASQIASVGVSGAAITVESYIAPWALAVVLAACTRRQLAIVATAFIAMTAMNACLGIGEAVLRLHLMPATISGRQLRDLPGEFRPYALFDHPLTAAMVTMAGVFLVLGAALRPMAKAALGALLLTGLLAWGGRSAIAATGVILLGLGARHLARAALIRTLSLTHAASATVIILGGAAVTWFVATHTSIGERALNRLYFDDSATSRTLQFRILGQLNFDEAVIGVANARLPELVYGLSLTSPFEELENPWLLAYLQLGLAGFLVFAAGLLAMIGHLWRAGTAYGKIIVVGVLLVASMSNSLGRKSNVLFLTVAAVYATRAAAGPGPVARQAVSPLGDPHAG